LDSNNNLKVAGRKQAFCLEDVLIDPIAINPPQKTFNCTNQGISRGWADVYGSSLDGQWLDVTGITPGNYSLRVTVNPLNVSSGGTSTDPAAMVMRELNSNYSDNVYTTAVVIPTKITG
jgi:hypothetical protein